MVNHILAPVLPGRGPVAKVAGYAHVHNDRPVTTLYQRPSQREPQWLCSVRRVDARGRVIDRALLPTLGWCSGVRLGFRLEGNVVVVGRFGEPELWITPAGDLRLPAQFRRKVGVHTADRILLAADPSEGVLLMFTSDAVDAMVARERQAQATTSSEVVQ
ncbi:hypothetical protein [Nocardia sp. CY15]|uniref:hypothetical protein n=1 Tax=Nocardia sp. CY15 TaxID=2608687 RepID=UPI0013571D2F|nr:hypothetical protein [Nocardia sp. CY15]